MHKSKCIFAEIQFLLTRLMFGSKCRKGVDLGEFAEDKAIMLIVCNTLGYGFICSCKKYNGRHI